MKYYLYILTFSLILFTPFTAYADPEDPVRFYLGMKLGYHGLIPSNIRDLSTTIGGGTSVMKQDSPVLSVFTVGIAGGIHIQLKPRLRSRTEIEYLYHFDAKTASFNDGYGERSKMKIASHTILANTYLDYNVMKFVALYVGVGVGLSLLEVDITKERTTAVYTANKTIPDFAWQFGVGTRIELTEYIFLDANFRYLNIGAVKAFGNPSQVRMKTNSNSAIEILFSAAYTF